MLSKTLNYRQMGVKHGLLLGGEACKLQMYENKILNKIYGPHKGETWAKFRILHKEERGKTGREF
jgi:hypothetical protein